MTDTDPRGLIDAAPMRARQFLCVAVCALLNALDGYDILSISFAGKGVEKEWGLAHGALGIVLSLDLVGMAVGSMLLGQLADRIGRVRTAMLSLVLMALGMALTFFVASVGELATCRVIAGLGIGGMLPTVNALVAEYTNRKWRNAGIALMSAGYPLGGAIGGHFAGEILASHGWRGVFLIGAGGALALLPVAWLLLPEPVGALIERRGPGLLAAVNRTLRILGHGEVTALPPRPPAAIRPSLGELFTPVMRPTTLLLTLGYFCHIITFYFMLKWVPTIVADMGFTAKQGADVAVNSNLGALLGAVLFSLAALKLNLKPLLLGGMVCGAIAVIAFGHMPHDLQALSLAAAAAGFMLNGVIVMFYPLIANSFPTAVRAGGTGVVIGGGRLGAMVGPSAAGFMFAAGLGLPLVAGIMACGTLLGVGVLLALFPRRYQA